jgi:DNA polymerase IV
MCESWATPRSRLGIQSGEWALRQCRHPQGGNLSELVAPRELRWLFLDLNSYFASVEQNEDPELRGKPIAVLPLMTDATCVIAASYEAKRFGVKTGTPVWEAKRLCPGIKLVAGRHDLYVDYHHRILDEVDRYIPVTEICSIDEVACRLDSREQDLNVAKDLARRIKEGLRRNVGPMIQCSIGLGPNKFLAKTATDMQKPDGFVVLETDALPGRLFDLELTDLCGIADRTASRLARGGILTVEQLWHADPKFIRQIWGGVVGERFWYQLHGHDLSEPETERSSVSHSQVLAPEARKFNEARLVGRRLTQKAAARLRRLGYTGARFGLSVRSVAGARWQGELRLEAPSDDNLALLRAFDELWEGAARVLRVTDLKKVGICVSDITEAALLSPSLFDPVVLPGTGRRENVSGVMDQINKKFGKDAVLLGMPAKLAKYSGTKIAFDRIPDREEFYE